MNIKMEIHAQLPLKITRRKNYVVASCPALDIHSQGLDETHARSNLSEAITLFILSAFEAGTLNRVLEDCGFRTYILSGKTAETDDTLDISIPLVPINDDALQCPA